MAFARSEKRDLIEPGVKKLFEDFLNKTIDSVNENIFNRKRWRKPTKKIINEIILDFIEGEK